MHDLKLMGLLVPVIVTILVVLSGIILIGWYQGQTSVASLFVRYLALPLAMLWLGFALAKSSAFVCWLEKQFSKRDNLRPIYSAIIIYCLLMFALKSAKLFSLNYEVFDAGIYINKLWRLSQAPWLEMWHIALVEGHFQPISVLFGMLYGWSGSPLAPYLLETVVLASGAIPVFLLSLKLWKNGVGPTLIAFAYLFNPIVHFNDILGFHPDHIVLPALLWAFYFAEVGRYNASLLALGAICLSSEPWILLASSFGIYLALQHKKIIWGLSVAVGFMTLFVFILFYLLPHYGSINSTNVPGSSLDALSSYDTFLSSSPLAIIKLLIEPRKLFFLSFLLTPFLLLPLWSWAVMIVALPDLAKTLLSSEMLHYSVEGHYTLGLLAVIFVGYIHALNRLTKIHGRWVEEKLPIVTLVITIGLSIAHSPLPTSFDFWSNWSGGAFNYSNYVSSPRTESLRKAAHLVGTNPVTWVEITNGAFTPELGMRNSLVRLFPEQDWKQADFIVLDKTKYKGSGGHGLQLAYEARLDKAVKELPCCFVVLYEDAYVELWSSKSSQVPDFQK